MKTPREIIASQEIRLLLPQLASVTVGEDADAILAKLDRAGFQIVVKPEDIGMLALSE